MKVLERVLFLVKYLLENNNDFKEIINRKGSNVGKLIVVIILLLLMIGHGVGGYIFSNLIIHLKFYLLKHLVNILY